MKLTARQIQRLKKLRSPSGSVLSYDQFRSAIGALFTANTLRNAMRGGEINPTTYHFLVGVLQKHAPAPPAEPDAKTAAAGDDTAEPETTDETNATHRGSR